MLKIIVATVAGLLVAMLTFTATRPDTFRVERAMNIAAPPERIFAFINDLHRWGAWSPYERKDPAMKRTHAGAASGKGAVYEWEGNGDIGKGRMEITDSAPPSRVTIQLDFVQPFEAQNVVEFTLQPGEKSTLVTWSLEGRSNFVSRLMGLFLDMDTMIGSDFEAGLASLKALAERDTADATTVTFGPTVTTF